MHTRAASRAQKVNDLQKVNVFKKTVKKQYEFVIFVRFAQK